MCNLFMIVLNSNKVDGFKDVKSGDTATIDLKGDYNIKVEIGKIAANQKCIWNDGTDNSGVIYINNDRFRTTAKIVDEDGVAVF